MSHLQPFILLPAKPGTCPECAVQHEPGQAHNAQSLHYQYHFFNQHGRWPTWADAIAHCDAATQAFWRQALRERNVDPDGASLTPAKRTKTPAD